MQETGVQSLGWDDLLEKEMATHCSIIAPLRPKKGLKEKKLCFPIKLAPLCRLWALRHNLSPMKQVARVKSRDLRFLN